MTAAENPNASDEAAGQEVEAERHVVRDERGRFLVPPKSPGRPRGFSQAELVRKLIEPHRQALIERALTLTKSEDLNAAAQGLRICLERLAPQPKHEAEKVEVAGLAEATTFTAKCQCVIAAVAAAEISAEAGERLLRLLNIYRQAVHHDDLVGRLAAVERELQRVQGQRVVEAPPGADCGLV